MNGKCTNIIAKAGKATRYETTERGVLVTISNAAIAARYFGATIRPVKGKFLTIPARTEAYGKTAGEFKLKAIFPKGREQSPAVGWLVAVEDCLRPLKSGKRKGNLVKAGADQAIGEAGVAAVARGVERRRKKRTRNSAGLPSQLDERPGVEAPGFHCRREVHQRHAEPTEGMHQQGRQQANDPSRQTRSGGGYPALAKLPPSGKEQGCRPGGDAVAVEIAAHVHGMLSESRLLNGSMGDVPEQGFHGKKCVDRQTPFPGESIVQRCHCENAQAEGNSELRHLPEPWNPKGAQPGGNAVRRMKSAEVRANLHNDIFAP